MTALAQVAKAMREALTTQAEVAGRQSGLIQRAVKLSGCYLAQMLVCGWLANPAATLAARAPIELIFKLWKSHSGFQMDAPRLEAVKDRQTRGQRPRLSAGVLVAFN